MELLIKNCKLVDNKRVDILIKNSIITKISSKPITAKGAKVIDANDKYVLPGAIDCHVHVNEPGATRKEDWATASAAAAAGGVTTILDVPDNSPSITTPVRLDAKRKIAKKRSIVNFGLYYGITLTNLDKLESINNTVCGYKLNMCTTTGMPPIYKKSELELVFNKLSEFNKPLVVHAESEEINEERQSLSKRRNDHLMHADSRPNQSEVEAIELALELAKLYGTRVHFTHVSTKKGLDILKKQNNSLITFDVSHNHLFFSRQDLFKKGGYIRTDPPLRAVEDQESLWKGIVKGNVFMIASDHSPHTRKEKENGLDVPSGVPHLDTFLPTLLNEVNEDKLKLTQLVKLTSENPARIFGLKNKGKIEEGYDADLVIVDMKESRVVEDDKLQTKCKWSPFNGMTLKGWPVTTIVGGKVIFNNGKFFSSTASEVQYENER